MTAGFALQMAVSLGLAMMNYQHGDGYRRFAAVLPKDGRIWVNGEWGLRSYQDRPNSTSWGGQNVFDVYSKSDGTGLDGTKYRDW